MSRQTEGCFTDLLHVVQTLNSLTSYYFPLPRSEHASARLYWCPSYLLVWLRMCHFTYVSSTNLMIAMLECTGWRSDDVIMNDAGQTAEPWITLVVMMYRNSEILPSNLVHCEWLQKKLLIQLLYISGRTNRAIFSISMRDRVKCFAAIQHKHTCKQLCG